MISRFKTVVWHSRSRFAFGILPLWRSDESVFLQRLGMGNLIQRHTKVAVQFMQRPYKLKADVEPAFHAMGKSLAGQQADLLALQVFAMHRSIRAADRDPFAYSIDYRL